MMAQSLQSRAEQSRAEQSRHALTLPSKSQEPLESQTASVQGTIAESAINKQADQELLKITAQLNYKKIEKMQTSLAKTLCARDYKGFGTGFDTMNGVIEWK